MIEYARILTKSSEGLPTIPPSASHDNGDWSANDIYENEFYIDSLTGYVYTRKGDTIVLVSTTGVGFEVFHDTSLTGDGSAGTPLGVAIAPSANDLLEVTADGLLVNPTKWLEIEVLNGGADTLPKMAVCYFKTSSSSADTPQVLLADNGSEATSSKTMGLLKDDIAPGERGKLILIGEYNLFDTSAYDVGDRLWLGSLGAIQTSPPAAPRHAVFIGIVSRSQHTNGRICVAIQNGYELEELHNVSIAGPTDGQVLEYDATSSLWKNVSPTIEIDPVTIVAGDWVADSGIFKYTYTDSHITALKVVEIIPANDAFSIVQGIEVLPLTESFDGYVEFYCNNLPTEDFNVTILVRI
jgi:hypothetical protein